jgi:crotonobetaine/carnitine-CoA ligase
MAMEIESLREQLSRKLVPELLRERAEATPAGFCLESGPRRLTFAELDRRSDRIAAGLAANGIARGDRVAVLTTNRAEAVEAFFACAKLGAIEVPLNAFLKGSFLAYQLGDAGARAIVVDGPGERAVTEIAPTLRDLDFVITVDEPETDGGGKTVLSFEGLVAEDGPIPEGAGSPADVTTLLYTSGTTGKPKGCMLSHGYYGHSSALWSQLFAMRPGDIAFAPTPFFHVTARMNLFLPGVVAGAATVLEPEFVAARTIARIVESGATLFGGVGAMGLAMLAQPPSDLDRQNSLRTVLCAPWTKEQQDEFERRFECQVWAEVYGQTECQPITIIPPSEPNRPRGKRVLGRPAPYLEVRVVDDEGRDVDVESGETGELVLRPRVSEAMFKGYWRKPEATMEAWSDLWHHTGDIVRIRDGVVEFADRKKDSIRRRGENVSSLDVEAAILEHPAVREVAVHGIESAATDEEIKACIVVEDGATLEADELFAYFTRELPYFAVPRYVEQIEELPRNAMGRIMKRDLRVRGTGDRTWDFVEMGLRIDRKSRR